jgi:hypothetical protein
MGLIACWAPWDIWGFMGHAGLSWACPLGGAGLRRSRSSTLLQPLNPILMLSLWFGEGPLYEQRGFLLMGYLSLAIILGILVWWTAREEDRARVRDAPR